MENISKIVVARTSGKKIGYVIDVAVDLKSLSKIGYYIVDEESESEFLLKGDDILSISQDFVLIDDVSKLEFVSSRTLLIGKEVLDENGLSLGVLKKICFKGNRCEKLVTDKCEILYKNFKEVGDDVIFVGFKKRTSKRKFPSWLQSDERLVQIQSLQQQNLMPEKIVLSSSFYVGKISSEDITGYNNERIISKGEVISRLTVEKAKRHNKLNQLFFAIKR